MSKKRIIISPYVFPGIKKKDLPEFSSFKKATISPTEIMGIVADSCGVTVDDILSKRRKREMCDARHMFCAIMRKQFRYSLKSIGEIVNGRDHTTAIHSIQTFNDRCRNEEGYKEHAERIVGIINSKL